MDNIVKRSDKVAFYGIPGDSGDTVFTRMKGFTELSTSKTPGEYTRQYVDEETERTSVVRYSPVMSFSFDEFTGDEVLADLAGIIDDEKLGSEAEREIIIVDFSKSSGDGFKAVKRKFSVIADSEGDSMDAYTYSGSFSACGEKVKGIATISEPTTGGNKQNAKVIAFTEDSVSE